MKKHIAFILAIVVSFIASIAWGASPAYENFNSGDFVRSGNSLKLKPALTNVIDVGTYRANDYAYATNTIVIYSNGVPIMVPLSYLWGTNQTFYVGSGFAMQTKPGSPARIYFHDNHSNGHGYVALGATSGDVVLNPTSSDGLLQLGITENAGNQIYMQYASNPLSNSQTIGFSHPLTFKALGITNGSAGNFKHYPGIVGFGQPDSSELGELWFYARTPYWNVGNHNPASPNTAGTPLLSLGTNGIIAQGSVLFRGELASPGNIRATNSIFVATNLEVGEKIRIGAGATRLEYWGLDISSGSNPSLLLGADLSSTTRSASADKYAYISFVPRTTSQPNVTAFVLYGGSGDNNIRIGGGTGVNQPATQINFYTGAAGSASAGTVQLQVLNGITDVKSARFIVSAPTVPSSASDTGTAGTIAWDANYIYVCTAANTWKRSALSSW